jgi:A/G-specific adenine glycosylase
MELGATVCTPPRPLCDRCPVAADCRGRENGIAGELPVRKAKRAFVDVTARVAVITKGGSALGHRVPADEPNGGQIELPGGGMLRSLAAEDLSRMLASRFDARIEIGESLCMVRHAITHHRITLHAHGGRLRRPGRLLWLPLEPQVPWTTPSRKVFRRLGIDAATLEA